MLKKEKKDIDPRIVIIILLVGLVCQSLPTIIDVDSDTSTVVYTVIALGFEIIALILYVVDINKNPNKYKK
ncbi:hypothetical protein [Clostridium vincentii]|uniref:Uncharacterized protein n=1 Tax=Clostridium vincentii TaxID=52704 RepID=A0A2T0B8S0_9CLOT|nr:hypothetical protein [Clostridium vincentii]PRR80300.1 hypothetical protein CLVI_30900 [Clostridium vincentii]